MTKPDLEGAARAYRPPQTGGPGQRLRVEIPVVRARRSPGPSLPIYSRQTAQDEPESLSRTVERSPFRAGLGFGLGFATGTALFRTIAVLMVYGFTLLVLVTMLRRFF